MNDDEYGFCLANGRGMSRNAQEAARYFKLAADQKHGDAQCRYGLCLVKGTGVAKSNNAVRYFKLA
jgi:TPR repeat protein